MHARCDAGVCGEEEGVKFGRVEPGAGSGPVEVQGGFGVGDGGVVWEEFSFAEGEAG